MCKNRKYCCLHCAHTYADYSSGQSLAFKEGRKKLVAAGGYKWHEYKGLKILGTYELRTCKILDKWKESGKIKDWSYSSDRISYTWLDGTEHTYIIDFSVVDPDDSVWFLETKGYVREHDKDKWDAAQKLGLRLVVWFKKDIEQEEDLIRSYNGSTLA